MKSDYFDGAKMAYNDVADWIAHMSASLPPELDFAASGFAVIAEGIRNKIKNLEFLLSEATEQ